MLDKSRKYALCLEGGGFRGSYQAGVIHGLHDNGVEFSAAAGTSVGALNSAFVAQKKLDALKDIWMNFKIREVFEVENEELEKALSLNFKDIDLLKLSKAILSTSLNLGLDVKPLMKLISDNVDEDLIRESDINFGLVTYNVSDRRGEELMINDIPEGHLHSYLLASSYLPGFKQQKLNGKYYLDGGVYNNMPSNLLARNGYEDIIQVRLHRKSRVITPKLKVNIQTITYEEYLGPIILKDKDKIRANFDRGYNDAIKFIENA